MPFSFRQKKLHLEIGWSEKGTQRVLPLPTIVETKKNFSLSFLTNTFSTSICKSKNPALSFSSSKAGNEQCNFIVH